MEDRLASLPADERDRVYAARELVDLALDGHFCIRDEIDRAIRRISAAHGRSGRDRMYQLAGLKAYASEEEIDAWQAEVLLLEGQMKEEIAAQRGARAPTGEPGLFDSGPCSGAQVRGT
jgi:hypothetical protein